MKKWLVFGLMVTTIAVGTIFYGQTATANMKSQDFTQGYLMPDRQGLLVFTNKARQAEGKIPLVMNENLNKSAQFKAEEIARTNKFDHIGVDGKQGYSYVREYDPSCAWAGENLAEGSKNSKHTLDMLLDSTSHKEAIMNEHYTSVGFGIKWPYVVQHFCGVL